MKEKMLIFMINFLNYISEGNIWFVQEMAMANYRDYDFAIPFPP